MSYRVSASKQAGAISDPAATLVLALNKVGDLENSGYTSVVIVDAGTGKPVQAMSAPGEKCNVLQ